MPLDPIFKQLLLGMPPLVNEGETPAQVRRRFDQLAANPALARLAPKVGDVTDTEVPGAEGSIPVRVYRPSGDGPHPTVVFIHGGAWFFGGLGSHDLACRELCRKVDAVVIALDYRLAPEFQFPNGLEDCLAAVEWIAGNVADFGGDADRIALAGDSAGGNLAAVVSQEFAARGETPIAAQLLIYPATDVSQDYPSRELYNKGYFLEQEVLNMATCYATDLEQVLDPRMSPLLYPKLDTLPPTAVVTAEFDPIRDQGEAYTDALEAAGVRVLRQRFDGLVHGFLHFGPFVPAAQAAIDRSCVMLRELLDQPAE